MLKVLHKKFLMSYIDIKIIFFKTFLKVTKGAKHDNIF